MAVIKFLGRTPQVQSQSLLWNYASLAGFQALQLQGIKSNEQRSKFHMHWSHLGLTRIHARRKLFLKFVRYPEGFNYCMETTREFGTPLKWQRVRSLKDTQRCKALHSRRSWTKPCSCAANRTQKALGIVWWCVYTMALQLPCIIRGFVWSTNIFILLSCCAFDLWLPFRRLNLNSHWPMPPKVISFFHEPRVKSWILRISLYPSISPTEYHLVDLVHLGTLFPPCLDGLGLARWGRFTPSSAASHTQRGITSWWVLHGFTWFYANVAHEDRCKILGKLRRRRHLLTAIPHCMHLYIYIVSYNIM